MSLWTRKKWITTIGTTYPYREYTGGHYGHDTLDEALAFQAEFNNNPNHPERFDESDFMGDPELNPRGDAER